MARRHIEGLRSSDPTTLSVLAQDLLRCPLFRLDGRSLSDLIALAESEQLPVQLTRDLGRFRDQMRREYHDLPDGPVFLEFLQEMGTVAPDWVPRSWRDIMAERLEEKLAPEVVRGLAALLEGLAETDPTPVDIRSAPRVAVKRADVPDSHKAPDERRRRRTASSGTGSKSKSSSPRRPTRVKDERREQWLAEDVMERLSHYGSRGLKQAILVAGAKHRSPFSDLADDEVVAALRRLERQGKVKHSAGRWSRKGRSW